MVEEKRTHPEKLATTKWAYIGDAVYETRIREIVLSMADIPMKDIQRKVVKWVSAAGQNVVLRYIESMLTQDDILILKRARNAKISSVPKSISVIEYRYATALEGLIGYRYLSGDEAAVSRLLDAVEETVYHFERNEQIAES